MPNNWNTYKLSEINSIQIIDGDRGKNYPSKNEFLENGYCLFLSAKNITKTGFEFSELSFISEEKDGLLRKGKLETNDIILTTRGTIGNVGYFKENFVYKNVRINSGMVVIRVDEAKISSSYVYQLFKSSVFQEQISSRTSGSAQPQLPIRDLNLIEINLPENLQEQQSIASILSAIDDKIENNLAINKTLEEMAMALYKHWFVDFGPFQDGEFVESELGMIPKNWQVKRLDEVCKITIGRTPPRKEPQWFSKNDGVKWISIKDLGNSGIYISETSEYLSEEAIKKFNVPIIKPNTVLLSFKLTVGRVAISSERMLSNEAIAHLNRRDKNIPVEFFYSYLKSFDYNSLGSTSSIATAVNTQTIKAMKIIVPQTNQLEDYFEKVNGIFEQLKINQSENQTLTQLRDTLLPQLISGAVRLKEFRE